MITVVIGAAITAHANAQVVCPNPAALTNGIVGATTWWAFQTEDGFDAQVGVFSATVQPPSSTNPFPRGVITGTQTSNNAGIITQRAAFTGVFTIDAADCSTGTISFNINGNAFQYTFVLADTFPATQVLPQGFYLAGALSPTAKLLLVTSNTMVPNFGAGTADGNSGIAYLLPGPPTCTNPADPLAQLLSGQAPNVGSNWSLLGREAITSNIATFSATETTIPFPRGVLKGTARRSGAGTTATLGGNFIGTFTVFGADLNFPSTTPVSCEGGQIFISGNGSSYQYDFVFAPPFDANGATRLLGVTSSNELPNPTGAASRANRMQAFRNFPHQ